MPVDIRDKSRLNHEDVLRLNFVRSPGVCFYRRHYRAGLRSHLMEVLDPAGLENERRGVIIGGLKCYPRAEPSRILRIFRRRFTSLEDVQGEIRRVKMIEQYLSPHHLAKSQ